MDSYANKNRCLRASEHAPMARFKLNLTCLSFFILAIMFSGPFSSRSDSTSVQIQKPHIFDSSYRSRSSNHKVIVRATEPELRDTILAEGGAVVEDYGAFVLMSAPDTSAAMVMLQSPAGSEVRDDMNVLLLRARAFDTTEGEPVQLSTLGDAETSDEQLYLVQMIGPVKSDWLKELESATEVLSYIPNNAYLVRARAEGIARINNLKSTDRSFIQWAGAFKPDYKIAPEISLASDQEATVTVQIVRGENIERDIQELSRVSSTPFIGEPSNVLNFTNVHLRVPVNRISEIARKSSVVWIEPWSAPELLDERQGLIIAGRFTGNQLDPPGYLAWLQAKGLATTPDFIVDIADTGLDKGVLDPAELHRDFLNSASLARVAYARYYGDSSDPIPANDSAGHGTINAAIVGGYNVEAGFPYKDGEGYSLGLGIHPFAKLGATRIFAPDYTNPSLVAMVDLMYKDGARISSNSWGAYNNNYTIDSQTYDSIVRDARRGEAGNQEMTVIFSSGNRGPGGNLTIPGTAKNVLTVGASENLRPGVDGCRVDSEGANDINSLIDFSSGGPTNDGRRKPEIVAPGTHIQGARSQDRGYSASGVCAISHPIGQTLYTWSSGTSHAAPAVAGAAALVRQFFQQSVGHPPSPAMVKAYLTNSTMFMTGNNAGDALPGKNQGWGLMDLGRALDAVPRMLIDQDQTISSSGQAITIQGRVSDPTKPFRVTLAWTDAPGSPAANPVVNNLDLQVDVGGKTYLGNSFAGAVSVEGGTSDNLNNIESVWTPGGASGEFSIRVVGANIAGDGVPGNSDSTDQDFALVVYNAQALGGGGGGNGGPVDAPPTVNLSTRTEARN
jgi:subtilisin family serine protease